MRATARFLFLVFLLLQPFRTWADFYLHSWEDFYQFHQEFTLLSAASFYSTKSNFDLNGAKSIPSGFQNYQRIIADLGIAYGFTENLSGFGRLAWSRNQINNTSVVGNVYGLSDQSAGVTYRFLHANQHSTFGLNLDLQFQADFPAYSTSAQSAGGYPFLGDGSSDTTVGLFASMPIFKLTSGPIFVQAGAGYTWRTAGYSAAIPWSFRIKRLPSQDEGWVTEISLVGIQSLRTDQTSPSSSGVPSGGSYIVNSSNPKLMSLQGKFGYQLHEAMTAVLMGGLALSGKNAPQGAQIGMGLEIHLGYSKISHTLGANFHPVKKDPPSGFVSYSLEAKITNTDSTHNTLNIDKGIQDTVAIGQVFDIFMTNSLGDTPVARAKCVKTKNTESQLAIMEYYKEVMMDTGFIAKRFFE